MTLCRKRECKVRQHRGGPAGTGHLEGQHQDPCCPTGTWGWWELPLPSLVRHPGATCSPWLVTSWGTKCWLSLNFLNVNSYIELAVATLDSSDTEESIINSFKHECPNHSLTIDHEPVSCPGLRRAPRLPGPQGWYHADLMPHKPPLCPVRKPSEHEGATRSSSFSCTFCLSWSECLERPAAGWYTRGVVVDYLCTDWQGIERMFGELSWPKFKKNVEWAE